MVLVTVEIIEFDTITITITVTGHSHFFKKLKIPLKLVK